MRKFNKTALAVVGAVLVLLFISLFFYRTSTIQIGTPILLGSSPRLHYALDESINLSLIRIKTFYFVPQDLEKSISLNWKDTIEKTLKDIAEFYEFQLRGGTTINFDIYERPVVGLEKRTFYDGKDTSGGNPQALLAIRHELLKRVFEPSGDLYEENFLKLEEGEYGLLGIIYEGVGSSATIFQEAVSQGDLHLVEIGRGELAAFLVNHDYLTSPSYKDFGSTIVAHEFGHTLGLEDAYDLGTGDPQSDDLMGLGRFRPLEITYISKEDKIKMGLDY